MLSNPRPGTRCQIWYRASLRAATPLHGKAGEVVAAAGTERLLYLCRYINGIRVKPRDGLIRFRCGPRNHLVRVDGVMYSVPCGHLRAVADAGPGTGGPCTH